MSIAALLHELKERLPELEWKVNSVSFSTNALPKGMFRVPKGVASVTMYISEIEMDIQALTKQQSKQAAYYLAQQIQQKINILVNLCRTHRNKPTSEKKVDFGLTMISTRQQWLESLEKDIDGLMKQEKALKKTLENMRIKGDMSALLHLQAELGEVEKRLTLAKETLASIHLGKEGMRL